MVTESLDLHASHSWRPPVSSSRSCTRSVSICGGHVRALALQLGSTPRCRRCACTEARPQLSSLAVINPMPALQILERVLPAHLHGRLAYLSGPSFAAEVAVGLPTVVTVASKDEAVAKRAQTLLSTSRFRCYRTTDVAGAHQRLAGSGQLAPVLVPIHSPAALA